MPLLTLYVSFHTISELQFSYNLCTNNVFPLFTDKTYIKHAKVVNFKSYII